MFRKVLIANRGEIAVRLMKACGVLGVTPVTVHSEADVDAPHARDAESFLVGPAAVAQSYLNQDAILEAALKSGCEAIHPGYGLLSENAAFARKVLDAGLAWVGPSPEAIARMGDKVAARAFARAAGVPVVPGTEAPVADVAEALIAASAIGYPVMLKAARGGGGIGMQRADGPGELEKAFKVCVARAKAYFGDGSMYVEKALDRPRHIEIQVLADGHGRVVHLGERECSVQRRHQKVVEEAGSAAVDHALRERMGEVSLQLVRALGYVNAGTLEYLLDASGAFYFLEMNTRLQVEHPVTEAVTGVDLAVWQLRIAAGQPLDPAIGTVPFNGHSIECRVYAEDPVTGYPSPGTLEQVRWPDGVRVDTFVASGSIVSPHYDPMLAKLVVHGRDRVDAMDLMEQALAATVVEGVRTNLPLLKQVLGHPEFRSGEFDTGLLGRMAAAPAGN
ncbi:MAG: biotin carboxylase N-terminal domain-containing protein [Candidatus Sericytochromatia bacterium]|nr:biotin carboxylase N-terminal domain-containing protein [Candidatus Sericytochromatia bacterium]